ncbi:MAG: hypothetical protein ABR574_04330 [Cryomorphaceae bacterium]
MLLRIVFLIGIFLLDFSTAGNAQDLIVKLNGDSLHVKITGANDQFIYYITPKLKKGKRLVVSRKEVATVLYNYEAEDPQLKDPVEKRGYEIFQIYGMYMGSRLLQYESLDFGDFSEYDDALRWSSSGLTAGINFFIDEQTGFGLLFSQNYFSNSIDVLDPNSGATGKLSDQITLQYYGANIAYRIPADNNNILFQINGGLGLCTFQNEASVIYRYDVTGSSLGLHLIGMANFSLGYGLYIPVQLGVKGFNIANLSADFPGEIPNDIRNALSNQISNQSYSITRLELSVGLMFAF